MMNEPYTREEFEKFARLTKGGNGYVEKRMIATVRELDARIRAALDVLDDLVSMDVIAEDHYAELTEILEPGDV